MSVNDWRTELPADQVRRFRAAMAELTDSALHKFQATVQGSSLFELFLKTTPVSELEHVHFGSRPAYRQGKAFTLTGIRAIPWNFGWTQTRLNLPVWLGVGSALASFAQQPGGLELLREMAAHWPFFNDMLGKIEMVCAKADLEIARLYVEELGGDLEAFAELEKEFKLTEQALLAIRGREHLIADHRFLQYALELRNPYVDPLSVLQVSLLRKKRAMGEDDPKREVIDLALGSTLNGIAQGMRNTG